MTYTLNLPPERRLSLKILAHKVRRYLPFAYPALLWLRYVAFPKRCRDLAVPSISYSDGSWITRKTTSDLLQIEAYLKTSGAKGSLLQIGIGNSSLFAAIGSQMERFVGLTIVEDEIRYAKEKFASPNYDIRLMNKYSAQIADLGGAFDYIVDNDISSYACCHHHFNELLASYARLLTPGGMVMIGHKGLAYFDSGFGLTPTHLAKLAAAHGLRLEPGEACYKLLRK